VERLHINSPKPNHSRPLEIKFRSPGGIDVLLLAWLLASNMEARASDPHKVRSSRVARRKFDVRPLSGF